ncbi:hypothetical protein [Streptomyces sp. NBC_01455]|uniref:hypothetical protein n=1 Tax=Streptomyces sp. NBC_01455 TaxID=2903874 RepID=UPI002E32141D|nr:hypothetical protein [Streptomyces sp. NBC_01455]
MGLFPDTADRLLKQAKEEAGEQNGSAQHGPPRFAHLKDVTLFLPGASPVSLPFWRGRLSSVSGWTLGKLGV